MMNRSSQPAEMNMKGMKYGNKKGPKKTKIDTGYGSSKPAKGRGPIKSKVAPARIKAKRGG
jgi:hypothetical protein